MLPCMPVSGAPCWVQKYGYVPGVLNVYWKVSAGCSNPESTDRSSQVTVWAMVSGLVHVTVVPAGTVRSRGLKVKFWVTTLVLIPGTAVGGARTAVGIGAVVGTGAGVGTAVGAAAAGGASAPGEPLPVRVTAQILPLPVLPTTP